MGYHGFRDLECYKEARKLRIWISKLVANYPVQERYMLVKQMVKSSHSVTANIAEGYGRFNYADTRNFFVMARGSLTETLEHLITSRDENYISEEVLNDGQQICEHAIRLTNGYISYLDKQKKLLQ